MLQNGPKEPRPRFRLKLFERKLTVPVTGEMAQRLEAESGAEELSRCRTDPAVRRYRPPPASGPVAETHAETAGENGTP